MSETTHIQRGKKRVVHQGTRMPPRPGPVPKGHPDHPETAAAATASTPEPAEASTAKDSDGKSTKE